jgi:signal transduction histidine kinase
MRERAEVLGGSLMVTPAEGGGTVVQARLPMTMATPVTAGISTKEVGEWSQSG